MIANDLLITKIVSSSNINKNIIHHKYGLVVNDKKLAIINIIKQTTISTKDSLYMTIYNKTLLLKRYYFIRR